MVTRWQVSPIILHVSCTKRRREPLDWRGVCHVESGVSEASGGCPAAGTRANYTGPDTRLHKAPATFDTREDAEAWLTDIRRQ